MLHEHVPSRAAIPVSNEHVSIMRMFHEHVQVTNEHVSLTMKGSVLHIGVRCSAYAFTQLGDAVTVIIVSWLLLLNMPVNVSFSHFSGRKVLVGSGVLRTHVVFCRVSHSWWVAGISPGIKACVKNALRTMNHYKSGIGYK